MTSLKKLYYSDFFGATISVLCIIHCTITPLLLLAKPILESAEHHGHGHHHAYPILGVLDWVFLFLSFGAVWYSASHTSHSRYRILFWLFWVVFAGGLIMEMNEIEWGIAVMYIGSLCLVATHLMNLRYCKKCEKEELKGQN